MGYEEGDHALVQKGGRDDTYGSELQADVQLGIIPFSSNEQIASFIDDMQCLTDKTRGTEFTDDDLLRIMIENIVEENAVVTVSRSTETKVAEYILTGTAKYSIGDERQKSLILLKETQELLAVTLQGGSVHEKVQLNLSVYRSVTLPNNSGQPTILGIEGTDLYLCCRGTSEKPILKLEEVQDIEKLKTIKEGDDMMHFLFLKKNHGLSMTTFESVMFRDSFICTASDEKKPAEMCKTPTPGNLIYFTLHQIVQ
ncbi:interleukin-1 beta-like [Scleropages formosus]|uniref:interleukin-1 beta-like n=1 Tax=Scleropages formosus TaxID=113540 RepID=UPI0010FA710C|nr:interleukin-1 beta-like [Scleropages formosus]